MTAPSATDTRRAVAELTAAFQVVLQHTDEVGDPAPLAALHQSAVVAVGADHEMTLLIECGLEEVRSRKRPSGESLTAWTELWRRVECVLPDEHTTSMSVRAYRAQYERRAGGAPERLAGPERYRAEWEQRRAVLGDDDYRTRIARANLAFALRERGAGGDLELSRRMLDEELEYRTAHYGKSDPFVWKVIGLQALTLISLAERDAGRPTGSTAGREALRLATRLVDLRRRRFGRFHALTLQAQLLHLQALRVTERHAEATAELRYLRAAVRRSRSALDAEVVAYLDRLAEQT